MFRLKICYITHKFSKQIYEIIFMYKIVNLFILTLYLIHVNIEFFRFFRF